MTGGHAPSDGLLGLAGGVREATSVWLVVRHTGNFAAAGVHGDLLSRQAEDALHCLARQVSRIADDDNVAPTQPVAADRQDEYHVARVEGGAHAAARDAAGSAVEC
ncbi:MAG: hypothetical protein M3O70_21095 [Actinomycetota bacterium]|nr:hypothetical protein [Actinomycetota bacterium]